eukprot:TRINITY_DN3946_c0_g2_i3.p1 TRINITY_DN3946_c0_g2~~TRINITY_DN3946_c0_g2_i3.p1  ORF type:complete len:374 (+),score=76.83 TRINITY_DN3946_c0_g2_i3:537-1658(+)
MCAGSTEQIQAVTKKGGIKVLKSALGSPFENNRAQAVWAIGNIAGEDFILRDILIKEKIIPLVVLTMEKGTSMSIYKSCAWCLANICRDNANLPPDYYPVIAKPLVSAVKSLSDPLVLTDCTWALFYLSCDMKDRLSPIIESGVIPTLISLLKHDEERIALPCLRILGNISTGSNEQTQAIIDAGVIEGLKELVEIENESLRKESVWVLSNIAAGSESQVERIIAADVIPMGVKLLAEDKFEVKIEALWLILNTSEVMPSKYVSYMLKAGIIEAIVTFLSAQNTKVLLLVLRTIENMLKKARDFYGDKNEVIGKVEELGCVHVMEELQYHSNQAVYKTANEILETFFMLEEIEQVLGKTANDTEKTISIFDFC